MPEHTTPKRISLAIGEDMRELYETVCELENVTPEQGFNIIFRPWVEKLVHDFGMKPDADLLLLDEIEARMNELFPKPVERAGGYVG